LKNTQNLGILILLILTATGCPPKSPDYDITWVLENELNERVEIEVFYIPPPLSNFPANQDKYTLKPKETLLLYKEPASDSPPSAYFAFFKFFNVSSADSISISFVNEKHISFLADDESQLNPFNNLGDESLWTTVKIDSDEYEFRYKITEAHKNAAGL
jgi:hypothetical protein